MVVITKIILFIFALYVIGFFITQRLCSRFGQKENSFNFVSLLAGMFLGLGSSLSAFYFWDIALKKEMPPFSNPYGSWFFIVATSTVFGGIISFILFAKLSQKRRNASRNHVK